MSKPDHSSDLLKMSKEAISAEAYRLKCSITNRGAGSVRPGTLKGDTLFWADAPPPTVHIHGRGMCSRTGPYPAKDGLRSYGFIAKEASGNEPAELIGALDLRNVEIWFALRQEAGKFSVTAEFQMDEVQLQPDEQRLLPELIVLKGQSVNELLQDYGRLSGEAMEARTPSEPVYGWCSWYHYYGYENEADIKANAAELKKHKLLPPGAVIQIDDGWNRPYEGCQRNWGDWQPGKKYPLGMKAVADELHAMDFRAGLWLAPFSADAASMLAQNHPDWLIGEPVKELLEEGENPVRGLDLTHPEVLRFIDNTFDRVFNEWGFDYVKLDFLMHALGEGKRYDSSITRTEAMNRAFKRIRRIAGERFILCCGCPFGPAVGEADAMRIGFDVGSRWHAPMMPGAWPHGNCSIKPAAYTSIHRHWMNGNWWLNDPDCLVVRGTVNDFESKKFNESHIGGDVSPEEFGLSEEEAGFWARLVHVYGTFFIISEVWSELPEKRQELVRKAIDNRTPYIMADSPDVRLAVLRHPEEEAVALFNISDETVKPASVFDMANGVYSEVFSGESLHIGPGSAELPEMAPHSARIWRLSARD